MVVPPVERGTVVESGMEVEVVKVERGMVGTEVVVGMTSLVVVLGQYVVVNVSVIVVLSTT
jgi:hypothetical protein